jgi:galactokinase
MTAPPPSVDRAAGGYRRLFGAVPDFVAFAPGRVNLIGEHTDYNDGFVLPCAIPNGTAVAFGRAPGDAIEAVALDLDDARDRFDPRSAEPLSEGHWANHVRGVARAAGFEGGWRLAIAGDVPQGAGLSSSAALGVALATGMRHAVGGDPDAEATAKQAQWSEHHFVGCACGIMDQLASASGTADHALLIDCRSLTVKPVPIPRDAAIVVVHSGVRRGLVESAYNARRSQCEAAARHFGVAALRDLTPEALEAGRAGLDATAWRRARHVVSENARTLDAADALASGDLARFGRLMAASHASLRDDFEVTVPPVDALVALMGGVVGAAGGVRMTGGGFGGCVVALLPRDGVAELRRAVAAHHARPDGEPPLFLATAAAPGARICGV